MGTLTEKLAYVKETKEQLKSLLIEKGENVDATTPFRSYVAAFGQAIEEGKISGRAEGYEQGKVDGNAEGYAQGKTDGYSEGQTAGYNSGYAQGKEDGYEEGVEAGGSSSFDQFLEGTTTSIESNASNIVKNSFKNNVVVTSINFPNATTIGMSAFSSCSQLQSANFPNATTIEGSAFYSCSQLQSANFPNATTIGSGAFSSCSQLQSANFPNATTIEAGAFSYCSKLTSLILSGNAVCTLANKNAFTSTPIASGTGYIYVPSALIDTYKAASNWSNFANQFRALEDYTVDGTTTGELDETKI